MDDGGLLEVLHAAASAVRATLDGIEDWGLTGDVAGQHHSDLAADAAALEVLLAAGFGVLSEESGLTDADRDIVVVLDPLDGSTNAHRGVPWFATSLCAVDADGPRAAVVVDQARDVRFEAVRGAGARRDGIPIKPTTTSALAAAVVGLSGLPPAHLGWKQFRALGAAALDLCAVACGILDAYIDCSVDAHGVWDYLGGVLVCHEAGVLVDDAFGRDLMTLDHRARRTPVAAATSLLHAEVVEARRSFGNGGVAP